MAVNLTKLSRADYYLKDLEDITLEGHTGADPAEYYTRKGNPPGEWIGSGSEALGYTPGEQAGNDQVRDLINKRRDPATQRLLGNPEDLIDNTGGGDQVAGWDLTLTQPKSVSVLWAIGDEATRKAIDDCIAEARDLTMARLESEYLATRAGAGGVATASCDGAVGFDFRHYDNREGEPHPHDHIVISNRVRRSSDKQWTAVDGRRLYGGLVELSEYYNNTLRDVITERLGWDWEMKPNTRGTKAAMYEIKGVPNELIDLFSTRDRDIDRETGKRIREEETAVGHELSWTRKEQIKNDVWRQTRKPKPRLARSLDEDRTEWHRRLEDNLPGIDIRSMMREIESGGGEMLHVDAAAGRDIGDLLLARISTRADGTRDDLPGAVMAGVERRRATWTRDNVRAEAQRLTSGFRVDPKQRGALVDRIADLALERCVKLTPTRYQVPEHAEPDGRIIMGNRSAFDDPALDRYTSGSILNAEDHIIRSLDRQTEGAYAPGEGRAWLERYRENGGRLSDDQFEAAVYAIENPNTVGAVIGPAGTGKTTTMKAVAEAWKAKHGPDSVIGMALANVARDELRNSIGCNSVNIAQFLLNNDPETVRERTARLENAEATVRADPELDRFTGGAASRTAAILRARESTYTLRPGQLVILDEAGMVGTRDMERILTLAERAGARILLSGDPRQLDTPSGAGGMLAHIERMDHEHHRELNTLWRFAGASYDKNPERFRDRWKGEPEEQASKRQWVDEGTATMLLREGGSSRDPASVSRCRRLVAEYRDHDRLHTGTDDETEQYAYDTVSEWMRLGKTVVLMASDNDQVHRLNQRFLLERKANGMSDPDPHHRIPLSDGLDAGIGDQILCRRNDTRIRSDEGSRAVANGVMMIVTGYDNNGVLCRDTTDGHTWTLPYDYVENHCEAGYAVTTHRAQGLTVDRSMTVVPSTGRLDCPLQYVGMTRGREENHICFAHPDDDTLRERRMLEGRTTDPMEYAEQRMLETLLNQPDNRTAHETRHDETMDRNDIRRLIHEHDMLAGDIASSHLINTLREHHDEQTVNRISRSPAFEWLRAVYSRAYMTAPRQTVAILSRSLRPTPRKKTGGKTTRQEPNTQSRRSRTPDPAVLLAARLSAGILDRRNGVIHDQWAGGVIPPVRARRHDAGYDLAKQNETMIERESRRLEHELENRNPTWMDTIRSRMGSDPNLLRDIAVYRAQWDVDTTEDPLGERPPARSGLREQQWTQIHSRITGTGPGTVTPPKRHRTAAATKRKANTADIDTGMRNPMGGVAETTSQPSGTPQGKGREWTPPTQASNSSNAQADGLSI